MKKLGHIKTTRGVFHDLRSAVQDSRRGRKDPLRVLDLSHLEGQEQEEAMTYLMDTLGRDRERLCDVVVWYTKSGAWWDVLSPDPENRWKATLCGLTLAEHDGDPERVKRIAERFLELHLQEKMALAMSHFSKEEQETLRALLAGRTEIVEHRKNHSRLFGEPLPEHLFDALKAVHAIDTSGDANKEQFVNALLAYCERNNPIALVRTVLFYGVTSGLNTIELAEDQRTFTTLVLESLTETAVED